MLLVSNVEMFVQNENHSLRFGIFLGDLSTEKKSSDIRFLPSSMVRLLWNNLDKIREYLKLKMSRSRRTCVSSLGKSLPQLNSGQTVWLFQLLFFLSTLIVQSEQQFKLTLVPSGDEQVVEAGSTVTVTCVLADYLILPGLSNVTWTAENRRKIQV